MSYGEIALGIEEMRKEHGALLSRIIKFRAFAERLASEDWRGHEPGHVTSAKEVLRIDDETRRIFGLDI